ncbi:MAG: MarR family transcriptional regulator [Actinomycetota bacterium]
MEERRTGGSLEEERRRYVEDFGLLFEGFGLARMVGRVLGALMVADPPEMSAEELAGVLRASRGSISTATRMLVRMGLVERVGRPGERRDYFRNKPGAWHDLMRREMEGIAAFREMAERGLGILEAEGRDRPEVRLGLEEMRDFYAYCEKELPALFERWEEESGGR